MLKKLFKLCKHDYQIIDRYFVLSTPSWIEIKIFKIEKCQLCNKKRKRLIKTEIFHHVNNAQSFQEFLLENGYRNDSLEYYFK